MIAIWLVVAFLAGHFVGWLRTELRHMKSTDALLGLLRSAQRSGPGQVERVVQRLLNATEVP